MESIETILPEKAKIGRPRRLRAVDLEQVNRQLLVVLKRETLRLMDQSFAAKLSLGDTKTLINYLKLLKDLRETKKEIPPSDEPEESEAFTDLSDEELKQMALKSKHGATT